MILTAIIVDMAYTLSWCRMTADAIKLVRRGSVYLPDLRNQSGWVTTFYVRNDSTAFQIVTIQYFDVYGNPTPWGSDVCALNPNQWCWIPVNNDDGPRIPAGTTASATVGSIGDVSVVAVHHHSGPEAWSAYTGISGPTMNVYSPMIFKNWYGMNSQLYIQNAGPSSTNVTVEFKANSGSSCTQTYNNVPAQGLKIVSLSGISCLGSSFLRFSSSL